MGFGCLSCAGGSPVFAIFGSLAIAATITARYFLGKDARRTPLTPTGRRGPSARWPTDCGRCGYSFAKLVDHRESRFSSCPECGWDVPWAIIAEAHRQEQLERERTKPSHAHAQREYAPPMSEHAPHPIVFTPEILEKVWGGRALEKLGKTLPNPSAKYGESWELADMDTTSASGAGGGAVRSVIAAGPLKGKSIRDAINLWGDALLPKSLRSPTGGFPLLIKFLDARENLSVQVHPSPEYARAHPGAHLKTECWCILAADPGASIYVGIRPGVSRERFEAAAHAGSPDIVEMLNRVPAIPGACHNLPSGTVHALGAGVLVAEVQTPSDTTFRLYDWGRVGRELHIEPALACSSFDPAPPPVVLIGSSNLVRTAYFELSSRTIASAAPLDDLQGHVVMVLSGAGVFSHSSCRVAITLGQTAFVPSQCEAGWRIEPTPGSPLTLLVARPLAQG
ncbi:MAG: class I mannose-6-phosphate isomerase [Phycisphaerales bacterium]|nr:class I mannose-6-phosphate isomerase [Phycisphaerales bacterium]